MKMKQVFYAALTARVVSLICLGVFFATLYMELDLRTPLQALGVSFAAWLVGSFFLGIYQANITRITVATMVAAENVQDEVKRDDDEDEYSSHPIFKDDDNE